MSKKTYRVRNWSQYNKALCQRGSLTFWFSPDVLRQWQQDSSSFRHGNQRYTDMLIISALTLRQLYRLPLRATAGLLESLAKLLNQPGCTPHYSTLSRRAAKLSFSLAVKHSKTARHVLVDSTGIQIIGEYEWKRYKYGVERCRYQAWRKLHLAMDADTQDILSATMTDSARLDSNQFPRLIRDIPGAIQQITADGAYDKTCCYKTAYDRGAKPVFPPQHNARTQRRRTKDPALHARDQTITAIGRGEDRVDRLRAWKEANQYHRRSLVESMMFRFKSLFGDQLRSKKRENQLADLLIRCQAMNRITQLGMPDSYRVD